MGPRVREDGEIKDGKKKPNEDQRQRTKTLNTAVTSPTVIPVHTGNHLPAHAGCRVWKYTRHNRQQEQRQYCAIPTHYTRYTMGPRVREDDENKKKSRAKFSGKEQKTQHTATTLLAVIPVHTGNHLSKRAGCRV
ncbi:TPA: hypothetical protein ACGUTS_004606 [Vibrio vulnificus]